jgi:hypothetical protein
MKCFILSIFVAILGATAPLPSQAGAPVCHSSSGGYCQYTGKVKQIYVNAGNTILMYFDTPINLEQAASAGFTNVTQRTAGAIYISKSPEFAKMFYATALAAQASGRNVTVQLRGNGGYLEIDRIWLSDS